MDGIEATRRIVRDAPDPTARVLVLTTFDADENVVEALRAGASGFLLKDVTPTDFVAAIRIFAAGDALLAPGSPGACSIATRTACHRSTPVVPRSCVS